MKRNSLGFLLILIPVMTLTVLQCRTGSDNRVATAMDYGVSMGYYQLDSAGRQATNRIQVLSVNDHLDVPWEVKYAQGALWYSLQSGEVYRMPLATGQARKVLTLPGVKRKRTMGSLGMAIDSLAGLTQVYLIYNTALESGGQKADTSYETELVCYDYDKRLDTLTHRRLVFSWPASTSHNGARVLIGRQNDLYVTTGDLEDNRNAQDTGSLNGKVLRIMKDGSLPKDNPFQGSYVWSYGHRNSQGICYGPHGQIYASEHGDAIEDEVNLIEKAKNYGWPLVEGKLDQPEEIRKVDSLGLKITEPLTSWTPTIAPASILYYNKGEIKAFENSLLLVTLKGNALYVLHLDQTGKKITGQDVYFQHYFGRLRSICLDEKGRVFIGTSNRDWNPGPGYPKPEDDHILMLTTDLTGIKDSTQFKPAGGAQVGLLSENKGQDLFINYCSSCHKPDGKGIPGTFPPLAGNGFLKNNRALVGVLQRGRTGTHEIMGKTYSQAMPNFSFLTDQEMLQLINYLKRQLVQAPEINKADFSKLRSAAMKP